MDLGEKLMRLTVKDAVPAHNRVERDGLRTVTLSGTRCPDHQNIFPGIDKMANGQFQYRSLWHLGIKAPVEILQALPLPKAGEGKAALQESAVSSIQLILDQGAKGLDESHFTCSHLEGSRLQGLAHAREPQCLERSCQFRHGHGFSPWFACGGQRNFGTLSGGGSSDPPASAGSARVSALSPASA